MDYYSNLRTELYLQAYKEGYEDGLRATKLKNESIKQTLLKTYESENHKSAQTATRHPKAVAVSSTNGSKRGRKTLGV